MSVELAAQAQAAFAGGRFEESLQCLQQLTASSPADVRVAQNVVLARGAAQHFRGLEDVQRELQALQRQEVASTSQAAATIARAQAQAQAQQATGAGDGGAGDSTASASSSSSAAPRAGSGSEGVDGESAGVEGGNEQGEDDEDREDREEAALADASTLPKSSVLLFNLASLHFQQRQYAKARRILDMLFVHIDAQEENMAMQICFLLLEVLVQTWQGSLHTEEQRTAFDVQTKTIFAFMERCSVVSGSSGTVAGSGGDDADGEVGGDGTGAASGSASSASSSSSSSSSAAGGNSNSGGSALNGGGSSASGNDRTAKQSELIFRIHLYRAKILIMLNHTKSAKKEMKNALEIFQRELRPLVDAADGASSGAGGGRGSEEGKLGARTAGSRSSSMNSTIAIGGHSMTPLEHQNMIALYIKANLEYLRKNFRKALKLLTSCYRKVGSSAAEGAGGDGSGGGPPQPTAADGAGGAGSQALLPGGVVYHNNVGCLYSKMQRYHAALLYYQKALQEEVQDAERDGASDAAALPGAEPDGRLNFSYRFEVLYNTGLSLLMNGKPLQAFKCLHHTTCMFYHRPHLWIRLAECCIQHDVQTRNRMEGMQTLAAAHVGQGKARRILVHTAPSPAAASISAASSSSLSATAGARDDSNNSSNDNNGAAESKESNTTASNNDGKTASTADDSKDDTNGEGSLCTLENAVKYLLNALYVIRTQALPPVTHSSALPGSNSSASSGAGGNAGERPSDSDAGGSGSGSGSGGNGSGNSNSNSNSSGSGSGGNAGGGGDDEASALTLDLLQETAQVHLAYVALCVDDPVLALEQTESLLASSSVSDRSKYLASTYSAEALCMLGRFDEALERLAPEGHVTFTEAARALSRAQPPEAVPVASSLAQAADAAAPEKLADVSTLLNAACVHSLRGNLPVAQDFVTQALHIDPNSRNAIRFMVYLYLRQGLPVQALRQLRTMRM